ncbi:MAG TPA: ribonuclease D [Steroidobacteraceae bacterium]|nr:ribonuclease D [Steroidobacteraceae bacterium]
MPEAVWIDRGEQVERVAQTLERQQSLAIDTEFLRERTFFPRLCLLQIAASSSVWCIDALRNDTLEPLAGPLAAPNVRKILHSARQDLEAYHVRTSRLITPVFDTQIAAACIGMRPQLGYAELVRTLLEVTLAKGETRTDWSRRPLSDAQLLYAADDVRYLEELAARLGERLRSLGREQWLLEDCAALADPRQYLPDPSQAWKRIKGARALPAVAVARLRCLAAWREQRALDRDLPRGWILSDALLIELAQRGAADRAALPAVRELAELDAGDIDAILEALRAQPQPGDLEPVRRGPPTPEEKAALQRLARRLDERAAELKVSPELLATRAELRTLLAGERDVGVLSGWRRAVIGEKLLEALE